MDSCVSPPPYSPLRAGSYLGGKACTIRPAQKSHFLQVKTVRRRTKASLKAEPVMPVVAFVKTKAAIHLVSTLGGSSGRSCKFRQAQLS